MLLRFSSPHASFTPSSHACRFLEALDLVPAVVLGTRHLARASARDAATPRVYRAWMATEDGTRMGRTARLDALEARVTEIEGQLAALASASHQVTAAMNAATDALESFKAMLEDAVRVGVDG